MSLFQLPRTKPVDGQGDPYAAAQLFFYAAGTTTPATVYSDADLTTAHTNPVVADSAGLFPAIFISPTVEYRVILKDADDVTLWDVDNVNAPGLSQSVLGSALYPITTAETAAGVTPTAYYYEPGNLLRYGADASGTTDSADALTAALDQLKAGGSPVRAPAGTYRVDTSATWSNAAAGTFVPGPHIIGDGIGVTIFDSRVASGYLFDIDSDSGDSHATFKGLLGVRLEGFTILSNSPAATSSGIKLRTAYMASLRHLHIKDLTGNGITIPCVVGDNDGSNMVHMDQIRIEDCDGWGIKLDGDSGHNETSFVSLHQVFVQRCGTTSVAAVPPSGGMTWKGQMLVMDHCAFTLNENCACYIPGQSGLGQTVDMRNTTFENNKVRGLYVTGISAFKGRNLQFYNNDSYTATNACEFDGASYTVRQVDIDGVVVRATSGNSAYTAFKISGSNADLHTCRVRHVVWDNFDYTGQTRFNGWQFDHVPTCGDVVALDATTLLLRPNQTVSRGNTMPLRLTGGGGGTPSSSGEWIAYQLPSSGLTKTNSGLSNTTRYYVYLYDNAAVPTLELSTTAWTTDTSTGYPVKTGDATRLYVGSTITDGSAQFALTGGGWLNPAIVPGSQTGAYTYLWTDSTGDLRVKYATAPTSDTDGTVVGTQT